MQKPKMLIGQAGVKYGLQKRDPKPQPQPVAKVASLFSADSDSDEENVGAQVARQAARKVADSKVQDMYAAALAEDPTAFDYDGVYESIQEQKAEPKRQDKIARQPKYIASLLEQAQLRKREQDISNERRLIKERQKEDHMYDNQEKFITSAYRRKLEEDNKWQESQRLKDLEEERNDVTKLGHMNNFFTNLSRNVAMGGTGASQQQRSTQLEPAGRPDEHHSPPAAAAAAAAAAAGTDTKQEKQQQRQQQEHEREGARDSPLAADAYEEQVHEEQLRHDGHRAAAEQQLSKRPQHTATARDTAAAAAAGGTAAPVTADLAEQQQQPQQQQQQSVGGKRKNDDAAVAAARERYLARKRQQA